MRPTVAMEAAGGGTTMKTVCVTGAGGFVASWLVERLLAGGRYMVHRTVRDPCTKSLLVFLFPVNWRVRAYMTTCWKICAWCAGDAKNAHLAAMDGAADRLRLFRADLLDYCSVAAAIAGCDGVFHVASPLPSPQHLPSR